MIHSQRSSKRKDEMTRRRRATIEVEWDWPPDTIADDFAEHGVEAIAKVRNDDPATYLRIVGSLVQRQLILQREESPAINVAEATYEELGEFIDERRRQLSIESALKSVG